MYTIKTFPLIENYCKKAEDTLYMCVGVGKLHFRSKFYTPLVQHRC